MSYLLSRPPPGKVVANAGNVDRPTLSGAGRNMGRRPMSAPSAVAAPQSIPRPQNRPGPSSWPAGFSQGPPKTATSWEDSQPRVQPSQLRPRTGLDEAAQRSPHSGSAPQDHVDSSLPTGLAVTWLGTSSGNPTLERNVSCTVVHTPNAVYLIDCGEGSHRQLQQAGVDPAKIECIFITHLHGDHCFGLATTLQMIDNAKAEAARVASEARRGSPDVGKAATTPTTRVFGPPGLGELLRVSLPGDQGGLCTRVIVTELVVDPEEAHAPTQLGGRGASSGREDRSRVVEAQGGAVWNVGACCSGAASGTAAAAPLLSLARLGSVSVSDSPSLQAAADTVARSMLRMPTIWRSTLALSLQTSTGPIPPPLSPTIGDGGFGNGMTDGQPDIQYSGIGYFAQWGRYWQLPCAGNVRVRAAQLQHRLPCWGYVIEELVPSPASGHEEANQQLGSSSRQEGGHSSTSATGSRRGDSNSSAEESSSNFHNGMMVGRKVVIMGDTVSSCPVAPLALDCDLIAHEATFMQGMEAKCRVAQHSTGWLAGAFAECVRARHLVLTHFSARYYIQPPPPQRHQGKPRDGGEWRKRPVDTDAETAEQNRAVGSLLSEARQYYRCGTISAAEDFLTVNVPQRGSQQRTA